MTFERGTPYAPLFVEKLDAITFAEEIGLPLAPVMVYAEPPSRFPNW
jgi:hypothetical protein